MPPMFADVCPRMNTGDILTFEGTAPLDYMIDLLEDGTYSHVGMVLRREDGELLFWDAPGGGKLFLDPLNGHPAQDGCRVARLKNILEYYMTVEKPYFTWRPLLTPRIDGIPDKLIGFIEQTTGTQFPGDTADIPPEIAQWFKQHFPKATPEDARDLKHGLGLLLTYLTGKILQLPVSGSFFCAQLVAQTYIELGLLPATPLPANGYAPANFDDQGMNLPLLDGVRMGPPQTIQWAATG